MSRLVFWLSLADISALLVHYPVNTKQLKCYGYCIGDATPGDACYSDPGSIDIRGWGPYCSWGKACYKFVTIRDDDNKNGRTRLGTVQRGCWKSALFGPTEPQCQKVMRRGDPALLCQCHTDLCNDGDIPLNASLTKLKRNCYYCKGINTTMRTSDPQDCFTVTNTTPTEICMPDEDCVTTYESVEVKEWQWGMIRVKRGCNDYLRQVINTCGNLERDEMYCSCNTNLCNNKTETELSVIHSKNPEMRFVTIPTPRPTNSSSTTSTTTNTTTPGNRSTSLHLSWPSWWCSFPLVLLLLWLTRIYKR